MRDFSKAKRIVVKIGTNILTKDERIDARYVRRIVGQISSLVADGRQVVVISSGAIGMGANQLKLVNGLKNTKMRQACAAIGQPLLMHEYKKSLSATTQILRGKIG